MATNVGEMRQKWLPYLSEHEEISQCGHTEPNSHQQDDEADKVVTPGGVLLLERHNSRDQPTEKNKKMNNHLQINK